MTAMFHASHTLLKKESNKIPFLLFFLIAFTNHAYTQTPQQDLNKLSYAELDTLFESLKAKQQYEDLLPCAQSAWQKAEKTYGKQDTTTAKWLYKIGLSYDYGKSDYQNALNFYNKALSIQKLKSPESLAYANTIFAIADIYNYNLGEYLQAESLYSEVLSIRKKILGTSHTSHVTCLNSLAYLYRSTGKYTKAETLYLEAIAIRKKTLGEQHLYYANILYELAELYQEIGNYTKAEPLYLQVRDIYKKNAKDQEPDYATILNNIGDLYKNIGSYAKAEPFYLESMGLRKKILGDQHPSYARSLNNLAYLYKSVGNYTKAEHLFLQAIGIWKKAFGDQHPDYAAGLNNLALLYESTKDYTNAEPLYLQAIAIWKKALGEEHQHYATSLNNLAILYQNMKNYAKAEALYLQALAIFKKTLGETHALYGNSLNNLAALYKLMKNYTKAEALFLQTMEIWKNALGENHVEYSSSLNNLADLYQKMGQLDIALEYCRLGIIALAPSMDSSFNDWKNLDTFNYSSNLQINNAIHSLLIIFEKQYAKTKDENKLKNHYDISQAAIRLNERLRNEFTSEGEKLRILSENNHFILAAIKTGVKLHLPDYEATAFGFSEINKGVLLLESAKTANLQRFGGLPDTLVEQEKNLQKKQNALTAKLLEKRPEAEKDSLRRVLNGIHHEIDVFTKMLEKKYPKYATLKYRNKTANAKEIQALLDGKTALLEYMIGDSVVYIFYIDKKQIKLTPIYLSNNILNEKIKTFYATLSDYKLAIKESNVSYQKYTSNAFWFYENLVKPALFNTKDITKLLIVSDGELGHLPFEAFLTKSAPQKETDYSKLSYLSNEYKISYNYSATIWKSVKEAKKNTNNGQILGMASNYDFKIDSTKKDWRLPAELDLRKTLNFLPAAHREIETLSKNFDGFFAFDKDASEKNFKSEAADYAVIHLAMHGLLDSKNPILSSLAFTEDGDSLENNFLQAYEISKMKLNADLVVLSACETGYGRFEKGNGITSLAQAFAYAGAVHHRSLYRFGK